MTQDKANVTRPPHLPRLRNRASLGRLVVFGGVLDFEPHTPSRTTSGRTLPEMPLIPTLYSHLAGPASSASSSSRLNQEPLMQSHNKQHDPPIQSTQHTPVKNTNSSSTLRALQASNQQQQGVKYPNSLSKGRPRAIPRLDLDFDHHHQHKQHQSRRISNRRQEHSRPQSESVSSSAQSSIDHSLLDSDEDVSQELEEATTRIKKEEEERLVNEIRQDMDEGGYASLEQILARNGFKVCRVATPPSTGRVTSLKQSSTTQSSPEVEAIHHHPLSKIISSSSSTFTTTTNPHPPAISNSSNKSVVEHNTGTIKNKTSMLSFSGIVSSFWSSSTSKAVEKDATNISKQSIVNSVIDPLALNSDTPKGGTPIGGTPTSSNTPRDSEDILGMVTGKGDVVVDRNEDIKGWLRQTFDASNAYMNDARKTIEAARMAMGSPESKKKNVQKEEVALTQTAESLSMSEDIEVELEEGENDENDTSLSFHNEEIERRQATASTLESELIETPTCSPVTLNHSSASKTIKDEQSIVLHPPYSPPLRQLTSNMEQPVINHQITYFDSPLMRKKMNRISLQTRQESRQQRKELQNGDNVVEYPPSSPDLKNVRKRQEERCSHSENSGNSDELQQQQEKEKKKQTLSAESLLRGTLRHAISESKLSRSEERIERYDTVNKEEVPIVRGDAGVKNGYRPSITSIFGIPLSLTSSISSSTNGTEASCSKFTKILTGDLVEQTEQEEVEIDGINKLKQSITDSMLSGETNSSLDTRSTSAKDTISTNASISTRSKSANAPKLLRKTASKHTLRKAASPVLSNNNSIAVYRDEIDKDENFDSVTPVKNKTMRSLAEGYNTDHTPVRNRPVGIRGPLPLKTPSPSSSANTITDSVDRKNITPRQIAHRNPRDSPIGETKVIRSPPSSTSTSGVAGISKRITGGDKNQSAGTPLKKSSTNGKDGNKKQYGQPCIMDGENDNDGLWSPPKFSTRPITMDSTTTPERAPLGAAKTSMQHHQHDSDAKHRDLQQKGKNEVKPRLKAKESLERLLAYKQMQEDDNLKENVPPVPALPAQTRASYETGGSNQTVTTTTSSTDTVNPKASSTTSTLSKGSTEETKNGNNGTLKHKTSFGGTLRGLIGSAVAGWSLSDSSTMMMPGDRNAPVSAQTISSSSTRRVAILPASKPLSTTRNGKNGNNTSKIITNDRSRNNNGGKSIRRARSMYVDNKGKKMGDRDLENRDSWNNMERERNNLILPTIIISDYTQ